MISHKINLTQSRQFYIITYSDIDFFLIIHHLIYLTFSVNFHNQLLYQQNKICIFKPVKIWFDSKAFKDL